MTEIERAISSCQNRIGQYKARLTGVDFHRGSTMNAIQLEQVKIAALRRTAEYDKAQREGRLVLRPCKVGDVVFVTFRSHGILEIGVRKVTGFTDKAIKFPNQGFRLFTDFGKTVFFSRAEAEAALGDERDE